MAKLTKEVQTYIVQQLACFLTPSEVARAVKEEFDLDIDRQLAFHYDPTRNADLPAKWRAIFDSTRAAFIADVGSIAVAHKSYRMRQLDKAVRAAMASKRYGLAAQLLRQAAEESGGVLTNRRELTGKDGAPVGPSVVVYLPDNGRDGPEGVQCEGDVRK